DVPSVHVRAAIELRERDQRCPPPEITGYDDIEEPVVDLRFGSDVHTVAEMRAVRGDDEEMLALDDLLVDHEAHRLRSIRRDRHERADEVAEPLADDARARFDALSDVAVDTEARADPRARAVARGGIHDRERVLGTHADHDVGASAFLIASCSSSDS